MQVAFDSGMVLSRNTVVGISTCLALLIFVTLETLLEDIHGGIIRSRVASRR